MLFGGRSLEGMGEHTERLEQSVMQSPQLNTKVFPVDPKTVQKNLQASWNSVETRLLQAIILGRVGRRGGGCVIHILGPNSEWVQEAFSALIKVRAVTLLRHISILAFSS